MAVASRLEPVPRGGLRERGLAPFRPKAACGKQPLARRKGACALSPIGLSLCSLRYLLFKFLVRSKSHILTEHLLDSMLLSRGGSATSHCQTIYAGSKKSLAHPLTFSRAQCRCLSQVTCSALFTVHCPLAPCPVIASHAVIASLHAPVPGHRIEMERGETRCNNATTLASHDTGARANAGDHGCHGLARDAAPVQDADFLYYVRGALNRGIESPAAPICPVRKPQRSGRAQVGPVGEKGSG